MSQLEFLATVYCKGVYIIMNSITHNTTIQK